MIYSPQETTGNNLGGINGNNVVIAKPGEGNLLPSVALFGSGAAAQTGGICKLFNAMVDHADSVTGNGASDVNELTLAAGETCYDSPTTGRGKFVTEGFNQVLTGNQMPFADITLSMGIAYTAQTGNLEVTPRIDYYYQSDAYSSVFNIEAQKIKAWDEINFSLMIVPTDADWNLRFWAQNLTDDRNVTGSGVGNSSVGHTTGVFVREGRSFGMSFGIGF